ncbi:hypothetical protein BCON_0029g00550 [Botryotinia convoluta]|uniref:RelA/SpoT domain-containing protein n=1 Tax=Botryotinia convoluta TaxID=54673 RepID=A0A4Z1IP47_9HELO|nr:hypothetical protein BCON_0029g00550 [Botryotinia convoluta]
MFPPSESNCIRYALIVLVIYQTGSRQGDTGAECRLRYNGSLHYNVIDICNKALTSEHIRHPPIIHRIKKWESAEGTLRRRQKEQIARQSLRDEVEKRRWSWLEWCRILGQEQCEQDIGPFKSPRENLDDLYDFSGLRISLYFPGDVERVVNLLSNRLQVISKWRKDQNSDIAQKLEKCIEVLNEPGATGKAEDLVKGEFPGYRATHLIVKLAPEGTPPSRISAWREIKVELQIGTLIMYVWSEIEHDMLYKPLASQDQRISHEEEQVLDIINGIVMTGEGALRQLETCMERRRDQRTKDKSAFAISHHELGVWIEKYCAECAKPLVSHDWNRLPELHEILKTTGDHQHSKVESIVDEVFQDQDREVRRDNFSLRFGGADDADTIIYYCHELLHDQNDPWVVVATLLSRTAGVIRTMDFGDLHDVLVPGIMIRVFGLHWSSHRLEDPDSRAWKLIDPPILVLKLLVSGVSAIGSPTSRGQSDTTEGLLSLLFRLHFAKYWPRVEKGYDMAHSLGRASVPADDNPTRSEKRKNHSATGAPVRYCARVISPAPVIPPAPVAHAPIMSNSLTNTQSTTVKRGLTGMKRMINKMRYREDSDTNNLRSAGPTPPGGSSSTALE